MEMVAVWGKLRFLPSWDNPTFVSPSPWNRRSRERGFGGLWTRIEDWMEGGKSWIVGGRGMVVGLLVGSS